MINSFIEQILLKQKSEYQKILNSIEEQLHNLPKKTNQPLIENTIPGKIWRRLNNRQKKALQWMLTENDSLHTKLYQELFNCSAETARRDFNKLIKFNLIKPQGNGRSREYSLVYCGESQL